MERKHYLTLITLLYAEIISLFEQRFAKKSKIVMKIVNMEEENLRAKIFKESVSCDNIESHKKQGFTLSLGKAVLKKPYGERSN